MIKIKIDDTIFIVDNIKDASKKIISYLYTESYKLGDNNVTYKKHIKSHIQLNKDAYNLDIMKDLDVDKLQKKLINHSVDVGLKSPFNIYCHVFCKKELLKTFTCTVESAESL